MRLLTSNLLVASLLSVSTFLPTCNQTVKQKEKEKEKDWSKYKFGVTLFGGKGLEMGFSRIYCDSLQMKDLFSADIWVDGVKISVKANRISVWSNVD